MKKIYIFILITLCYYPGVSQISGNINTYTTVSNISTNCTSCPPTVCSSTITVASTAGFTAGGRALIIQMKGAVLNTSNTASFGDISSYNGAGNYEFVTIASVNAGSITTTLPLKETYDVTGRVQLITVPQYTNVTVSGVLSPTAWNGSTGGVLVFEATGVVTLNANINADGRGFRKANLDGTLTIGCSSQDVAYYFQEGLLASPNTYPDGRTMTNIDWRQGAYKAEGIADFQFKMEKGKGKWANGGGGGGNHNAGGGGGGNGGAGGFGGNAFDGGGSSTCDRPAVRGIGGAALVKTTSRAFMGGGGGEGHANASQGTTGTDGGGIIIIRAASISNAGGFTISANGINHTTTTTGSDGAGGGGAGGTIMLDIPLFSNATTISARGGKGGDNSGSCHHAPGGGGGGGVICLRTNSNTTTNVAGGVNGLNTTCAVNNDQPWNSTPGSAGIVSLCPTTAGPNSSILNERNCTLPVTLIDFSGNISGQYVKLSWVTLSEFNSSHFEIEKSAAGKNYFRTGLVTAAGNSNHLISYQFDDPVAMNSGILYYRLKEVDIDGSYKYSKIISVSHDAISEHSISCYPNPIRHGEALILQFTGEINAFFTIRLTDLAGKIVYSGEHEIQKGANHIDLKIDHLSKGNYLLYLIHNNKPVIRKIMID